MNKYTKEQKEFIKENVKGISLRELTNKFNKKFDLNVSEISIQNLKQRMNLKSEIVGGRFEKGNIPHNKGKKWDTYLTKEEQENILNKTLRNKDKRYKGKKINTEVLDSYNYIHIKTEKGWISKQRMIYEKEYGEVPKGHKIIFLDGNSRNFDKKNLKMIKNSENLIINKEKLRYQDKSLTETGILIAKIIDRKNKLRKEVENEKL